MANTVKKCRVCGKEYIACRTARQAAGVFRWQEVACSPECGSIYLARIEESRRTNTDTKVQGITGVVEDKERTASISKQTVVVEDYFDEDEDEDDALFEEDFDDDEDDCEEI